MRTRRPGARRAAHCWTKSKVFYIQLEQIGALSSIRRYFIIHQEGNPGFDMPSSLEITAFCYAGVLSMLATSQSTTQKTTLNLKDRGACEPGITFEAGPATLTIRYPSDGQACESHRSRLMACEVRNARTNTRRRPGTDVVRL